MSNKNMNPLIGVMLIVSGLYTPILLAEMQHGDMARGEMQMQGGTAPDHARDPHAYSGGFTLTEGPYAQSGPRQLKRV